MSFLDLHAYAYKRLLELIFYFIFAANWKSFLTSNLIHAHSAHPILRICISSVAGNSSYYLEHNSRSMSGQATAITKKGTSNGLGTRIARIRH